MRIDKFLKNSRLIKRRTIGKEACAAGKILINDKVAKPGTEVHVGDILTMNLGPNKRRVEILEVSDHVPKDRADQLYRELENEG